jgi:hypothetical protein
MNTKIASVALGLALLGGLSGCYKKEFEAEKAKAEAAAKEVESLNAQLSTVRGQLQQATTAVRTLEGLQRTGGVMESFGWQNGTLTKTGTEAVRLNERGVFVRHGARQRENGSLTFSNGQLADQSFTLNRSGTATKYVEGTVRGSKAEGEWMWYDRNGKLTHIEVWKDGKLTQVDAVSVDRAGKQTRRKLSAADMRKFYNDRVAVFQAIPELLRSM